MLESCMESSNETVRRDVSKLQQRINRIANEQGEMNNPNSNSS
jgi:DeoR/GlpR family transcriptional regulator of sugar metabolism